MTTPSFVDCRCGHAKTLHPERNLEACRVPTCDCEEYAPRTGQATTPTPPPRQGARPMNIPTAPTAPTAEQLLAAGKRSDVRAIAALAERIEASLTDLRARLAADRDAAVARAEVRRLEEQLAAAKARLRTDRTPPNGASKPVTAGEHACTAPNCDRSFATTQARAMHQRRAHEGFDPRAPKAG